MTERQIKIKDICIRISNVFQLGLSHNDQDWFYKFIIRMDEKDIWHATLFFELDFIDKDFHEEFIKKIHSNIYQYNAQKWINFFGIEYLLNRQGGRYGKNPLTIYISHIKNILKDEWIIKYEHIFDDTCLSSSKNSYSNREKESAWFYILQSTSISDIIKEMYKNKSIYIDIYDKNGNANNCSTAYYNSSYSKIVNGYRACGASNKLITSVVSDAVKKEANSLVYKFLKLCKF